MGNEARFGELRDESRRCETEAGVLIWHPFLIVGERRVLESANAALTAEKSENLETAKADPRRLIGAVELRELFGNVTEMTISRWLKDDRLDFPKPIRIATRRYWFEAEVLAWIEARPREGEPENHSEN